MTPTIMIITLIIFAYILIKKSIAAHLHESKKLRAQVTCSPCRKKQLLAWSALIFSAWLLITASITPPESAAAKLLVYPFCILLMVLSIYKLSYLVLIAKDKIRICGFLSRNIDITAERIADIQIEERFILIHLKHGKTVKLASSELSDELAIKDWFERHNIVL